MLVLPEIRFFGFHGIRAKCKMEQGSFSFFAKFYEVLLCETLKIHQVYQKICANYKDNLLKIQLSIPFSKKNISLRRNFKTRNQIFSYTVPTIYVTAAVVASTDNDKQCPIPEIIHHSLWSPEEVVATAQCGFLTN